MRPWILTATLAAGLACAIPPIARADDGARIHRAQQELADQGYYKGPLDGRFGPRTRAALQHYQHSNGLPETARLDPTTYRQLTGDAAPESAGGSGMPWPGTAAPGSGGR